MYWCIERLNCWKKLHANVMAQQFPSLKLRDNVASQGVDIDGDTNKVKTLRVYERRNKKISLTRDGY
ncbi:hypothetical protein TSUD_53770 [Trifolium subterraneum]|uniref:Uncharacterized protein n=1 Tax=Trifolium subterraneum TaxID=3900 RepID=A0A2Z6N7R4_TRISU|nr:hypothetical protein TSUD_53770 [Trifolium subterraneum]